jgi:hypothetical protein
MIFENSSIAAATAAANSFATSAGFARELYVRSHYASEFIPIRAHRIIGQIPLLIRLHRCATGKGCHKECPNNPCLQIKCVYSFHSSNKVLICSSRLLTDLSPCHPLCAYRTTPFLSTRKEDGITCISADRANNWFVS